MTDTLRHSNLGEWQNAPIVQDQVIAYMGSIGAPMLLREIYRPLGLPAGIVNRVLRRLHAKGFLARYKIPMEVHRPGRRGEVAPAGGVTRQCYLYAFAETGA